MQISEVWPLKEGRDMQDFERGMLGCIGIDRCRDDNMFIVVEKLFNSHGAWIGVKAIKPRMRVIDGNVVFGQDRAAEQFIERPQCECDNEFYAGQGASQFECTCGVYDKYISDYEATFTPAESSAKYKVVDIIFETDENKCWEYGKVLHIQDINYFDRPYLF